MKTNELKVNILNAIRVQERTIIFAIFIIILYIMPSGRGSLYAKAAQNLNPTCRSYSHNARLKASVTRALRALKQTWLCRCLACDNYSLLHMGCKC